MLDTNYPSLVKEFLQAMEDIGQYGYEKYKEISFQYQASTGDRSRPSDRHQKAMLLSHSYVHSLDYRDGVRHDHFHDLGHQLAAAAFNLMMEYYFAKLDLEDKIGVSADEPRKDE